ncbi:MAG: hypothetical protein GFH27_549293n210 [Chloroflexi bacterium AL-W]|nr:hypothetical protein [Chloroflexi bacterium AL-N1]NOK67675.1 hypothetical protein [Chloroflexi bacterium AL-N10]NOK75555.1 hypothetical protein [Chloroflexi bacterium AL-N5]NOK82343.1 hypothetical protein [Chloroflexi bacterium AL-W]NOK90188.1 hypothetical protein [Chloroflexi bacterium AL-N15]
MSSILLFGLFLIVHAILVTQLWGSPIALVSLLFIALPSWRILWFSHRANIALGLTLLLGTLTCLLVLTIIRRTRYRFVWLSVLGFVVGLGAWVHPITLIYSAALLVVGLLSLPEWADIHRRLQNWSQKQRVWCNGYLPTVGIVFLLLLLIVVFFTSGCQTWPLREPLQLGATVMLLGMAGVLGVLVWQTSQRRSALLLGNTCFVSGASIGNIPQWTTWLFQGTAPSSAMIPACPTDIPTRAGMLLDILIPQLWGLPALHSLIATWNVSSSVSLLAPLLILMALCFFVWRERAALHRLFTLAPLTSTDYRAAMVLLLFGVPLLIATLSGNIINGQSVRHIFITWQASMIILAIFVVYITSYKRWLGIMCIVFWSLWIGFNNITYLGNLWEERSHRYASESVAALEDFLSQRQVQGAYADYWMAYALTFVTEERLTIAPYNGIDRYPSYTEFVQNQTTQAYLFWGNQNSTCGSQIEELEDALERSGEAGVAHQNISAQLTQSTVLECQDVADWNVWIVRQAD